jgi:ADP-ribose pyrophosphatase YjhB (NUDIX family)
MKWKTLSTEYIVNHQYFTARRDVCEIPDGRIVPAYFVVELPVSVCAMAITDDGNVILVNQYRHPVGEILTEVPGGFVDEGEDPDKAIARELLEETGYEFDHIDYVGKVAGNPGLLTGYTHLYLARGGKKVAKQSLDPNEQIDLLLVPVEDVRGMLQRNKFAQALHVSCFMYAFQLLDSLKKE